MLKQTDNFGFKKAGGASDTVGEGSMGEVVI